MRSGTGRPPTPSKQKENMEMNQQCQSPSKHPRRVHVPSPTHVVPMSTPAGGASLDYDDRIRVYLRMRPLLPTERGIGFHIDSKTITINPPSMSNTNSSSFLSDKSFSFRDILDETASQQQVFDTVAAPLLGNFMKGEDVLIFCYGPTNAGKTYTVTGPNDNPGILKRSLDTVVSRMLGTSQGSVELYGSYIEVYNEKIYDLLNLKEEGLRLGVTTQGDVLVRKAVEIQITSMDDVDEILEKGEAGRHKGCTEFNCDSSRSHTIFRLKLQVKSKTCWLSIVDLGGCERLATTDSSSDTFKEACNINKSMLVLGKCIRMLKDRHGSRRSAMPFRESKLTHIFKSFFEPVSRPSRAVMIVNASPSMAQIDDTIFALQLGAEASQCAIRHTPKPEEERESTETPSGAESLGIVIPGTVAETSEELMTKIRKKVNAEADVWMKKREEQHQRELELLSATRQSPFLNLAMSRKTPKVDPALAAEVERLEAELARLEKENKELEDKNELMKSDISDLRKKLSEKQLATEDLASANRTLKRKIRSIKKQNASLKETLESEQREFESMEPPTREVAMTLPPKEKELAYPAALETIEALTIIDQPVSGQAYQPPGRISIPAKP